jgi:hypothetical protein
MQIAKPAQTSKLLFNNKETALLYCSSTVPSRLM